MVATHTLTIDVEDIYFLIGLSHKGIPVVLIGPQGGEQSIDDMNDDHCSIGTHLVCGKIPIKHIIDRQLSTITFTIEKVAGTRAACLRYAIECMSPTIFN